MNHHYSDIRERIAEEPKWFDENAVPRYCEFAPNETADIYAYEVALVLIECQSCERKFRVAMSASLGRQNGPVLERPWLKPAELEYGDPPNVHCCPTGPTMNSVPIRVLEFWECHRRPGRWNRRADLEIEIVCEWMPGRERL